MKRLNEIKKKHNLKGYISNYTRFNKGYIFDDYIDKPFKEVYFYSKKKVLIKLILFHFPKGLTLLEWIENKPLYIPVFRIDKIIETGEIIE